jgi:AraC-like DNA-binding protein
MTAFELTGLVRVPLLILHQAEEVGLDRKKLMAAADLTDEELSDPDGRVPLSKFVRVWRAAAREAPPSFGLRLGKSLEVRQFGLVGYAILHSASLRQALQRLARYSRIIVEIVQVRFQEKPPLGLVSIGGLPLIDEMRHPADARLASIITIARQITGEEINPVEVCFPYHRPMQIADYEAVFRAPLRFGRPTAQLVFREVDLDRPVVAADETLAGYLDHLAEEVLDSLSKAGSLAEQARRAIWRDLSNGSPNLEQTASRLGMSARSLQRRLRAEWTSFASILDELRHELALHLLRDPGLAVYEIAFLLGYSEPSTFFRAFRRWEQTSPLEFRQSLA